MNKNKRTFQTSEILSSIHKRTGYLDKELLNEYYSNTVISPIELPEGFDDYNDESALLYMLSDDQRAELGFPIDSVPEVEPQILRDKDSYPQPVYNIRIQVILCANDDGSGHANDANAMDANFLVEGIKILNVVYKSAGIQFEFNPLKDFERVNDTLLNLDFKVPDNIDFSLPESEPPLSKDEIKKLNIPHTERRQIVAKNYCNKLVIYCCEGNMLFFDQSHGWIIKTRSYAFSSSNLDFVAMPTHKRSHRWWANLIAHEAGHYFHQRHTHRYKPGTIDDAADFIKDKVNAGYPIDDAMQLFDGDKKYVTDTPPCMGPAIFRDTFGDACQTANNTVDIPVDFGGNIGIKTYSLTPAKENTLSYFIRCYNIPQEFSAQQITLIRESIANGNRHHLIDPKDCIKQTNIKDKWFLIATWAWVVMIGGIMITPGGIDIIASNPVATKLIGASLLALGLLAITRIGKGGSG